MRLVERVAGTGPKGEYREAAWQTPGSEPGS